MILQQLRIMQQSNSENIQNIIKIGSTLCIQYKKFQLSFHQNFTTAHSVSATRTNFIVRILSTADKQISGYGECGLPPKKPGIYMSDIEDCFNFMKTIEKTVTQELQNLTNEKRQKIQNNYFEFIDVATKKVNRVSMVINLKELLSLPSNFEILLLLYILTLITEDYYRAPKSALQFCLLDYLAHKHQIDIFKLLYGESSQNVKAPDGYGLPNSSKKSPQTYSYYTVSMDNHEVMMHNLIDHLKYTRFIKIKYNSDILGLMQFLKRVVDYENVNLGGKESKINSTYQEIKIIIDANCSWGFSDYKNFEQNLSHQIAQKIMFIEQPFDFDVSDYDKWAIIKKETKFKLLADQSFRNENDLPKISKICHAINIKCQKTGGFFNSVRAASQGLQSKQLDVMFGSMVSTQLACTQTYLLAPFAQFMDIDGSLLVKSPIVQGGFFWNSQKQEQENGLVGRIVRYRMGYGLGISRKNCQQIFKV